MKWILLYSWQSVFVREFIFWILNLLTELGWSLGSNPVIMILILRLFAIKLFPMLTIDCAISAGWLLSTLFVPHCTTAYFNLSGNSSISFTRHKTFSARSPHIPLFNDFYFFMKKLQASSYLWRPLTIESPIKSTLAFDLNVTYFCS